MSFARTALTVLTLCLLLTTAVAQEWSDKSFKDKIGLIYDRSEAIALCRQVCEASDDLDLLRVVQDNWGEIDRDGARAFFAERMNGEPESARATYLYGRLLETGLEKVKAGRRVINLDPEWTDGYRLLMAGYSSDLFNAEEPVERLEQELVKDGDLFTRFPVTGEQIWMGRYLMEYQLHQDLYTEALVTLESGKAAKAQWAHPLAFAGVQIRMGQVVKAWTTVDEFIGSLVAAGRVAENERADYAGYYFLRALREAEAWQAILDHYEQHPPEEGEEATRHYDLACCYSLKGDTDEALVQLTRAVDLGFNDVEGLKSDTDLDPLHRSKRWRRLVKQVATNHEQGAAERRTEILAGKFQRPAPEWSLLDDEGNTVSLSDLRGEVLVLDFWATWCGPCRMAMPVLDSWIREDMPPGVRVFSINVWEQKPVAAAAYMTDNDYRMELLYGSNELATSYGVTGIPYLCVIDGEGQVRFEETGYSPDLLEKLGVWAGDLLQP